MNINESIYGSSSDWVTPDANTYGYGLKTTAKTVGQMYVDGDISINEHWDDSIAPWGIGIDSIWAKKGFPIGTETGTIPENVRQSDGKIDRSKKSCIPIYLAASSSSDYNAPYPNWCYNWQFRGGYDNTIPEDTTQFLNYYNIKPITQFNYSQIVMLITVHYSTTSGYTGARYRALFDAVPWDNTNLRIWGFSVFPCLPSTNGGNKAYRKLSVISLNNDIEAVDFVTSDGAYMQKFFDNRKAICAPTYENATQIYVYNRMTYCDTPHKGFTFPGNYSTETEMGIAAYTENTNSLPMIVESNVVVDEELGIQWSQGYLSEGRYMCYIDVAQNGAENVKNYIKKQVAYLGFWFTTSADYVNDPMDGTSENIFLPVFTNDNITTGRWVTGDAIPNEKNSEWTDDVFPVGGWDGEPPVNPDPNTYDDDNKTILNDVVIRTSFCTRYALTSLQLRHAHNFLCTTIATDTDSEYWSNQKLYVNNPMDCIQNVMLFPFDISAFQTDEPSYRDLTFGQLIDEGYSVEINREQYCTVNMGSCTYYPAFGNSINDFRNYPPYSSATLYIPYCGSVEIDPNLYMGHTIGVKIIVDMATGSCLALILRDDLVVDSISGTMGITVPITGIQTQTLAAAERQAESQLKTARNSAIKQFAKGAMSIAASTALGGVVGTVAMGAYQSQLGDIGLSKDTLTKAQYNLEHINVPYKTIGTATPTTSFANERKCRLIIRRPVMLSYRDADYAHTTGYACLKTGKVSDFTGYTEFQSVDLSDINATSTEKEMIYKLLQGGVFN